MSVPLELDGWLGLMAGGRRCAG